MATQHQVNFRSDGPVSANIVEGGAGVACLEIGSRRQTVQVSLTAEQLREVKQGLGIMPPRPPQSQESSDSPSPTATSSRNTTNKVTKKAPKKVVKKKTTRKATKKKSKKK